MQFVDKSGIAMIQIGDMIEWKDISGRMIRGIITSISDVVIGVYWFHNSNMDYFGFEFKHLFVESKVG